MSTLDALRENLQKIEMMQDTLELYEDILAGFEMLPELTLYLQELKKDSIRELHHAEEDAL